MDGPPLAATLQCVCGKLFLQHAALNHHTRSCGRSKKQLSSALSKAKEEFIKRQEHKKQRREELGRHSTNESEIRAANVCRPVFN